MDLLSVIYNVFSMLDDITTPEGEEDLWMSQKKTLWFYLWGNVCTKKVRTKLQRIHVQKTVLQTHNRIYI